MGLIVGIKGMRIATPSPTQNETEAAGTAPYKFPFCGSSRKNWTGCPWALQKKFHADGDDEVHRRLAENHEDDDDGDEEAASEVEAELGAAELAAEHKGVPAPLEAPHGRRQRRRVVRVAPPVSVIVDFRLGLGQYLETSLVRSVVHSVVRPSVRSFDRSIIRFIPFAVSLFAQAILYFFKGIGGLSIIRSHTHKRLYLYGDADLDS